MFRKLVLKKKKKKKKKMQIFKETLVTEPFSESCKLCVYNFSKKCFVIESGFVGIL